MLRNFALIILCLYCFNSYSQAQDSTAFIEKYFGVTARLVYTDRLDTYNVDLINSVLSKDTLYGFDSTEVLIISSQERIHIGQALTKLSSIRWSSSLFKYGKLISQDTVRAIFKDREHRGWQYFKQHYGTELHEFSSPIFIRDNTLCIFYSGYTCGYECGEGALAIFKKEKKDWVLWMKLYVWVS
jgi:hypothetical protein